MSTLENRLLNSLLPWRHAPAWRIAYSGGLDSTVLLHALAGLSRTQSLPAVSAIHVQHGLQAAAEQWPAHCQAVCAQLDVPLLIEVVTVDRSLGSLENAARTARYAAFERLLDPSDLLLTAQHQDDQAETMLFRMLRGSGLKGLAAMPPARALGRGVLFRPFLGVSRAELEAYAQRHKLNWVEDPSNSDCAYSRNYLRQQIIPLLAQRWPAVGQTLARSAGHLAEAQALLDELAFEDLQASALDQQWTWLALPSVEMKALGLLSEARQRNALRAFLAPLTDLPDTTHWAGWLDLRDAANDAKPVWKQARGELHRAAGRLWWLPDSWLRPVSGVFEWALPSQPLQLPGNGHVTISGEVPGGALRISYRQGGEQMQIPGRGHRDLKRLLNEAHVPVFVRDRLPLLCHGEEILAVANLPACSVAGSAGWKFNWTPPAARKV